MLERAFQKKHGEEWPYISALGGRGDLPTDALQLGDQRLCSGGVYPHLRCCVRHCGSGELSDHAPEIGSTWTDEMR